MTSVVLALCSLFPVLHPAIPASLLQSMRDHDRPVLLFADPRDPRLTTQFVELQQHAAELRERQMRMVLVTTSSAPNGDHTLTGAVTVSAEEAAALRSRFHIASGSFALILIGKDGGEKFRTSSPVAFEALRDIVDSMPMRQQEMQRH